MTTRRLSYRDGDQLYPIVSSFNIILRDEVINRVRITEYFPIFSVGSYRYINYEGVRVKVLI